MNKPPKGPQVKCPRCGRAQKDRGPSAIYFCDNCRGQFDNEPLEGGDYSDRNPAARLEREERQRAERKNRKH